VWEEVSSLFILGLAVLLGLLVFLLPFNLTGAVQ
jgi:hypothetical protein